MKKVFSSIVFLFISFIAISTLNVKVKANSYDDKIYCSATIDDNFDTSIIHIVLNENASMNDKEYSTNDFSEINCIGVEDMTKVVKDNMKSGDDALINKNIFRRVLKLKIGNPGKVNIINSIRILEKRNDVYAVSPNYYSTVYRVPEGDNLF